MRQVVLEEPGWLQEQYTRLEPESNDNGHRARSNGHKARTSSKAQSNGHQKLDDLPIVGENDFCDLLCKEIPLPPEIIPGVLKPGVLLIGGDPKSGKSLLAMELMLKAPGPSVYFALEDTEYRLQQRMLDMLNGHDLPRGKIFYEVGIKNVKRIGQGLVEQVRAWLLRHPQASMVVIDPFFSVKPSRHSSEDPSIADRQSLEGLKDLSEVYGVCIALIHHTRKADSRDPFKAFSGTHQLQATVDDMWMLVRDEDGGTTLHLRGRDGLPPEVKLVFDEFTLLWRSPFFDGYRDDPSTRERITQLLQREQAPMLLRSIAESLHLTSVQIKMTLSRMVASGQVKRSARGLYELPTIMKNGNSMERCYHEKIEQTGLESGLNSDASLVTPITTPVTNSQNGLNELVEPTKSQNAMVTGGTGVTIFHYSMEHPTQKPKVIPAETVIPEQVPVGLSITPNQVVNYPDDIFSVFRNHTIKMKRHLCTRKHRDPQYLPYFNKGEWVGLCGVCYPALRTSHGARCFEEEEIEDCSM